MKVEDEKPFCPVRKVVTQRTPEPNSVCVWGGGGNIKNSAVQTMVRRWQVFTGSPPPPPPRWNASCFSCKRTVYWYHWVEEWFVLITMFVIVPVLLFFISSQESNGTTYPTQTAGSVSMEYVTFPTSTGSSWSGSTVIYKNDFSFSDIS